MREMSIANRLSAAPRIHGELLKLGIDIGQTSVAKYMAQRRGRHEDAVDERRGRQSVQMVLHPIVNEANDLIFDAIVAVRSKRAAVFRRSGDPA